MRRRPVRRFRLARRTQVVEQSRPRRQPLVVDDRLRQRPLDHRCAFAVPPWTLEPVIDVGRWRTRSRTHRRPCRFPDANEVHEERRLQAIHSRCHRVTVHQLSRRPWQTSSETTSFRSGGSPENTVSTPDRATVGVSFSTRDRNSSGPATP